MRRSSAGKRRSLENWSLSGSTLGGRCGALVAGLSAQNRRWRWPLAVAAVLIAALVPLVLAPSWQGVLFFPVAVYVLLALGLHVVVGLAGLLDLGYVAFYAVGAYTAAKLTTAAGWSSWEALPIAIVVAMVAGVVLGAPTLRLRGDYLAIVTLGFGEIARLVAQNSDFLGEARGITAIPHPSGGFAFAPLPYYEFTLAAVVGVIAVVIRLDRSGVGRAWAAIRYDEDAAEAMGVATFRMKLWAFAIGAGIGGLGGWIYASRVSFISPDNFPFSFSVIILAAVVLGGLGSVPGAIAGAAAVALLPEYLRDAAAGETLTRLLNAVIGGRVTNITEYRVLLFGAALVVMMAFRPRGLLPSTRRRSPAPPDSADISPGPRAMPAGAAASRPSTSPGRVDQPVLEIRGLRMTFGGVVALAGVDLVVGPGEILGVIGPNGAGKTTVFNCITGVFRATAGTIRLDGHDIVGQAPYLITRTGVARTFQNGRLFGPLTVLENVIVGVDARSPTSVASAAIGRRRHRRAERTRQAEALGLLELVGLAHRAGHLATSLAYGDQRRLEIARAVATRPLVLLLDEPAAGMTTTEKSDLIRLVRQLRDDGLSIVIIEHDMSVVMPLSDRVVVLDFGVVIAQGSPAEVQSDARVIEAYLGTPA